MSPLTQVREIDGCAHKRMDTSIAHHGTRLQDLSRHLISQGVLTPPAHYDPGTRSLVSPWIRGVTVREFANDIQCKQSGSASATDSIMAKVATPLISLHGARADTLSLPQFDPFRRVTPRLAAGHGGDPILCAAGALYRRLRALAPRFSGRSGTHHLVHGDYHVGQLVMDGQRPTPWLLDLEDVSFGWAESDIANFASHFATSADLYSGDVLPKFRRVSRQLSGCYRQHGGAPIQTSRIDFHGAVSLLRRALKAVEKGTSRRRARQALAASSKLADDIANEPQRTTRPDHSWFLSHTSAGRPDACEDPR